MQDSRKEIGQRIARARKRRYAPHLARAYSQQRKDAAAVILSPAANGCG